MTEKEGAGEKSPTRFLFPRGFPPFLDELDLGYPAFLDAGLCAFDVLFCLVLFCMWPAGHRHLKHDIVRLTFKQQERSRFPIF